MTLLPVSRQSTPSLIAQQLRSAIMHGVLEPGSQLGEVELAAQFGVSRGPLREAMQRLVQEGLLRSEHNRGLFVITLQPEDVRDIYTARAAVERAAVTLIVKGDRQTAAAQLQVVHGDMVLAAERGDRPALSDADLRFHEALVELSGSPRLTRMHGTLLVETRMCLTALQNTDRPSVDAVEEHGDLVDAVRAGGKRRLIRLIDAHMDDALRRLIPG
ncbi:MAG: GntR family transcriptional regulator [Actinomycetota bacterium]|nr:GntR family transcriptional regulator [Actinomycetota bacterium]